MSLFTFGGLGLGLKNPVLFASLSFGHLDIYIDQKKIIRLAEDLASGAGGGRARTPHSVFVQGWREI